MHTCIEICMCGVDCHVCAMCVLILCLTPLVRCFCLFLGKQEELQAELHERMKAEMMERIQQHAKDQAAKLSEMVDSGDKEEVGNKDGSNKEKKREKYD